MAAAALLSLFPLGAAGREESPHRVQSLRIQILSTMLADSGTGEWGFAALVDADGKRFLRSSSPSNRNRIASTG